MTEISTSEMVGHLRQATRLFKSFSKAADAAELLCDWENKVGKLKKEVDGLTEEVKNLTIHCEVTTEKIKEAEEKTVSIEAESKKRAANVDVAISALMDKARIKADGIVTNANNEIELVTARVKALKLKEDLAVMAKKKADGDLAKAEKRVVDFKKKFASS